MKKDNTLKFQFGHSIVTIKGRIIELEINIKEELEKFLDKYYYKLKEKYKDFTFILKNNKNIINTKEHDYMIFNDNNMKLSDRITTISRLYNYNEEKTQFGYKYELDFMNIDNETAIKGIYICNNKLEFKINELYIFGGFVKQNEIKDYEREMNYNNFYIEIKKIKKYNKENLLINKNEFKTKRYPLCINSNLSNGFIKSKDIEWEKEKIENYIITDFNNLNFLEKNNSPLAIKLYFKDEDKLSKPYSIYLYLKQEDNIIKYQDEDLKVNEGIRAINELITNSEKYKQGYLVELKDILKYKDYFYLASMDSYGIIFQSLLDNDFDLLFNYCDIFDYYGIEHTDNLLKHIDEARKNSSYFGLIKVNDYIRRLAIRRNKKIIFSDNAIIVSKEHQKIISNYIIAEQIKKLKFKNNSDKEKYIEKIRLKIPELLFSYIKNTAEVIDELYKQGFNINEIENILNNEKELYNILPKKQDITVIPKKLFIEDNNDFNKLLNRVKKIINSNNFNITEQLKNRLNKELKIIKDKKYSKLFLMASIISKRINDYGYPVSERGTASNMLITYLLGISNINPLKFNLDYKMFLGPNLEKIPDIDMNISSDIIKSIQDECLKYFDNTCKASTLVKAKKNYIKLNTMSKTNNKLDINFSSFLLEEKLNRIQPHNSGILILPKEIDLNYITPLITYEDQRIPLFPYDVLEKNICKLDLLSKTDFECLSVLEKEIGVKKIDLELTEVFNFIKENRKNLPELNSEYAGNILKEFDLNSFNDLIKIEGLIHGRGIFSFAERIKKLNNKIIFDRESLLEILNEYNIENSFCIMEKIRKGNQDKLTELELKELDKLPEYYKNGIKEIGYLYPRSHSIAYAKQCYYNAYYLINKDNIIREKNKKELDKSTNINLVDEMEKYLVS